MTFFSRNRCSRRNFLKLSGLAVASLASRPAWASRPLNILILGGTGFTGPHQVETALGRGHKVTLFNRGVSAPGLFPNLEAITGDRDGDLSLLANRKWDAVIDNSGNVPRWVESAAAVLKGNVGHYFYVSSISVYADQAKAGLKESDPLISISESEAQQVTGTNYGGVKALCEQKARQAFPNNLTIARLGLVVGPGDPTDRFTYWPVRVYDGGMVLAPGKPEDPIQCIDARDFAQWTIASLENKLSGVFNVTGPRQRLSMGEFLEGVKRTTNADCDFTWVDASFLQANKVIPWADMPLWVPPSSAIAGLTTIDISQLLKTGISYRPMAFTVEEALAWYRSDPNPRPLKAGLTSARESSLLRAWMRSRHPDFL